MIAISKVRFVRARADDQHRGLLAFASCNVAGLLAIDGLRVCRTEAGRLSVRFPKRSDTRGGNHAVVRPLTLEVRRAIERAVLDAYEAREGGRAA